MVKRFNMCQLLGLSSNKKVDIQFSLNEFRHRGYRNPHGWGFAFLDDGNWNIIKEPYTLSSEDIKREKFQFRSKIIIGHVRLASCGKKDHQNTHPFETDKWVFAHNGTINKIMGLPQFKLVHLVPKGQTDSEYAFCYLLEKINENSDKVIDVLEEESKNIRRCGRFNFLLSDGEKIFAHGDNSLFFVQRKAPFDVVTLRDNQYSVDLGEIKAPDEKAILIATEPLTENEDWQQIDGIKIFKDGEEGI
ncbi:MAG TPA: class II glutamine amidotransferase [Candidatus Methanoperedens sp.]